MPLLLKIAGIQDETDRIRVFNLVPRSGVVLPPYTAGAHLVFDLGAIGTRSYSLIDWPGDNSGDGQRPNTYQIAVQCEEDGLGGSKAMHALAIGDSLTAEGPKNDFELSDHAGPVLLLAGGIGVTPLISMATRLEQEGRPFRFVYAARSRSMMGFRDKLEQSFGPALMLAFDDKNPLVSSVLMSGLTPDTHLYICGPRGMIDAARSAAIAANLPEKQIHVELFTTPDQLSEDSSFEVEIASSGQVFTVPPGRSIIEVLENAGVDLMYDCQRGDCGICQTDVVSGIPDHRDLVLTEAERDCGKLMQICVSRAKSARLVLDL
jgi:vanillate O-demethylase ferredoxin subunit